MLGIEPEQRALIRGTAIFGLFTVGILGSLSVRVAVFNAQQCESPGGAYCPLAVGFSVSSAVLGLMSIVPVRVLALSDGGVVALHRLWFGIRLASTLLGGILVCSLFASVVVDAQTVGDAYICVLILAIFWIVVLGWLPTGSRRRWLRGLLGRMGGIFLVVALLNTLGILLLVGAVVMLAHERHRFDVIRGRDAAGWPVLAIGTALLVTSHLTFNLRITSHDDHLVWTQGLTDSILFALGAAVSVIAAALNVGECGVTERNVSTAELEESGTSHDKSMSDAYCAVTIASGAVAVVMLSAACANAATLAARVDMPGRRSHALRPSRPFAAVGY